MSERPIQLNLSELGQFYQSRAEILSLLSGRLLSVIFENALDGAGLETDRFRQEIAQVRVKLTEAADPGLLRRLSDQCLQTCDEFFARCADYLSARDSEFHELIDLVREALTRIAGDSEGIDARLEKSSQRFKQLIEIDDIRGLRRELSRAVVDLQRTLEDKKKREHAQRMQLSKQVASLESKVESTMAEALRDPLTGVNNRRRFDQLIKRCTSRRDAQTVVLAMIDLNDFKLINDTHGHAVGDHVLTIAARCLSKGIRATDLLARYGGDEFAVIFRDMPIELTRRRLNEIMLKIAASRYEYLGVGRRVVVKFSASFGLAEFQPGDTPETLIRRADEQLYLFKKAAKAALGRSEAPAVAATRS